MIDVEESALRAFKQNILFLADSLVQQDNGVGDKWFQVVTGSAVLLVDLLERQWLGAESLKDFIVLLELEFKLRLKSFRIHEVKDPQTGARGLIAVSRTDAAFGSADLVFALERFPLGIQFAVIRENQVRRFAQKEVPVDFDSEF